MREPSAPRPSNERPGTRQARSARPLTPAVVVAVIGAVMSLAALTSGPAASAQADQPWTAADFIWPLSASEQPDAPMTSPFGPRLQGSQNFRYDFHRGIDLLAEVGTPIYAIADGTIRIAGEHPAYSDMLVQLKMTRTGQSDLYANYTHLSGVEVAAGETVEQGDLLGYTGVSQSGFPHLHFEIRRGGLFQRHALNPLGYLPRVDTGDHTAAVEIADTTTAADGLGRDVVVRISAPEAELDIDAVRLQVHAERDQVSPAPVGLGVERLDGFDFGFEQLNFDQTPMIDGSSDISILDNPLVVLNTERPTEVIVGPGRFDGRNPPWNIATYEIRFVGVPIPDPATVPYHLAASVGDVSGNQTTAWSSPVYPTSFEPTDGPNFHRGEGAPRNLRVAFSEPLDPSSQLDDGDVSCGNQCSVTVTNADYGQALFDLRISPEAGAGDLAVVIAPGALTDLSGRLSGQASTAMLLDDRPPTITGSLTPRPNSAGWISTIGELSWQATDQEPSVGFAQPDLASTVVDQLGFNSYPSPGVCDALNNCAVAEFAVGFDNVAPAIAYSAGPAPGSIVAVAELTEPDCAAADQHSGVDDAGCVITTTAEVVDSLTEVVTVAASATDRAGNTSALSWRYTVLYDTPFTRAAFREVRAELAQLADLSDDDQADVDAAVAALAELDEDRNWIDESRFDDTRGPTAFRIGQTALRAIDHIGRADTDAATIAILDRLQQIAEQRIADARFTLGDIDLLARADARLATGEGYEVDERWSRASTYYRYGWFWAREAARMPQPLDDLAA